MATFGEAVGDAVRAGVCSLIAEDPNAVALLERTGLSGNPLAAAGRAFRLAFCSNNDTLGNPPNYSGGQCPVQYNLTATVSYTAFGNPRTDSFGADKGVGPLSNWRWVPSANGQKFEIYVDTADKGTVLVGGDFYDAGTSVVFTPTPTRVDGNPDNCGDEPTTFPPPTEGPIEQPINITFEDNSTTTNLDGSLRVYAPIIAPTFSPRIPFRLNLGGLSLNGELGLDGEVDLNFDFGTGAGSGEGPPEPPEGNPPDPDTSIIGAYVSVVSDTGQTTTVLYNDSNPDLYLPRCGIIQFLQPVGSDYAWSGDIPIKTSPQWVPCPSPGYASRIAFTATLGVVLEVRAVYGRPPADETE